MPTYKPAKDTHRARAKGRSDAQGMNWIRQEKRLAIYLRDGLACVYCATSVEDGAQLTLDHVKPHKKGGTNATKNLVTCCSRCNPSRGTRSVATFAVAVAGYVNHGVTYDQILEHLAKCVGRDLEQYMKEAKELIARRGSVAKVLARVR